MCERILSDCVGLDSARYGEDVARIPRVTPWNRVPYLDIPISRLEDNTWPGFEMATTEEKTVNGVDVSALEDAVGAISDDPEVGRFTFRAETTWEDALNSITSINEFDQAGETVHTQEFTLQGDEPKEILGERAGPNAVEMLLGALGSCLTVGYAANAAHMGIELDELRLEMEGDVDLRGFLGISEDVRPGYESISCTVYVDADAPEAELAKLHENVEATSPLVDVIKNQVGLETRMIVE